MHRTKHIILALMTVLSIVACIPVSGDRDMLALVEVDDDDGAEPCDDIAAAPESPSAEIASTDIPRGARPIAEPPLQPYESPDAILPQGFYPCSQFAAHEAELDNPSNPHPLSGFCAEAQAGRVCVSGFQGVAQKPGANLTPAGCYPTEMGEYIGPGGAQWAAPLLCCKIANNTGLPACSGPAQCQAQGDPAAACAYWECNQARCQYVPNNPGAACVGPSGQSTCDGQGLCGVYPGL